MSDLSAFTAAPASCLNCGHALAPPGAFCPQCGQPPAHRLSTAHVAHELAHVFTHADKGVLAYLPALLLRPGHLVADYLAGRRKRYFNPFQFLLLAVAVATLLVNQLHSYHDLAALNPIPASYTAAQAARAGQFYAAQSHFYNLWSLLLLPLDAGLAWLVFRRQGVNYAEAFFLQVVVQSAYAVYLVLLLVVAGLAHRSATMPGLLLGVVVLPLYFAAIGRTALGLRWPAAIGKALLFVGLFVVVNSVFNQLAFVLYLAAG